MVNYELAKQLKDAGFPQTMKDGDPFYERDELHFEGEYESDGATYHYNDHPNLKDEYHKAPTLEELISIFGDKLLTLQCCDGTWDAIYGEGTEVYHIRNADTATIAIAKLWLALNKKT